VEGREATTTRERAGAPGASELLRAALEKIVFFEWRLSELTAEMAAAQSRTASAEAERQRAHEEVRKATLEAQEARRHTVELEGERARLASLLARPSHAPVLDEAALFAERDRAAQLSAELDEARRELLRQKDERARWLQEMIEQARQGDEAPAALAQFISELRSEVLELRDRQRRCDAQLVAAGLTPPAPAAPQPAPPAAAHEHDAVAQARKLWAEGRLGETHSTEASPLPASFVDSFPESRATAPRAVGTDFLPGLAALNRSPAVAAPALALSHGALTPARPIPAAQRALVEQCLRGLTASDAARRAQAARHLASLPLPAAAPGLAAALGRESDPRAKAAIARALAACGGDGAAALIAQLQISAEPPLVRLAALDALFGMAANHARAALETAAFDAAPALRRRAAALALSTDEHADLIARLSVDPDASVRSAAGGEGNVPEAPLAEEEHAPKAAAPVAQPSIIAPPTVIDLPPAPQGRAQPAPSHASQTSSGPKSSGPDESAAETLLAQEALFAVRTAILGLTDSDLADALNLDAKRAESLVHKLLSQGLLARRGKRLIVGAAVENAHAERGA
jgi:hypothetical protein